jgi:hypothetical protein
MQFAGPVIQGTDPPNVSLAPALRAVAVRVAAERLALTVPLDVSQGRSSFLQGHGPWAKQVLVLDGLRSDEHFEEASQGPASRAPEAPKPQSDEGIVDEVISFSWRRDDTVPRPLTRSGDRGSLVSLAAFHEGCSPGSVRCHRLSPAAAQASSISRGRFDLKRSGHSKSAPELRCEDLPYIDQGTDAKRASEQWRGVR